MLRRFKYKCKISLIHTALYFSITFNSMLHWRNVFALSYLLLSGANLRVDV